MTALLTGATGFLGSWIARALNPSPGELRVLVRPTSDLSVLDDLPVEVVVGDLLDRGSLARALEGIERVYHVAGLISFKSSDTGSVRRVNFEGAVNLFDVALQAGVQRLVYTASIFALGCTEEPSRLADEEVDYNLADLLDIAYLRAKRDAELAAQDALAQGLPLIRLYPGLCLGPGDRKRSSSGAIDAWLRGQLPAIITGGGICLMDVRDAALAHLAAMECGQVGRRYLATGHNVTLPGLFSHLAHITGQRPPLLHLPPLLGVPLARVAERLGLFPALDSDQARLMSRLWWYDTACARDELGITFRPLVETLQDTVAWLLKHPA